MPEFSIVVPAFNAASTLGETLDSVAAQTYETWEVIVVDDGSSDGTAALADGYAVRDTRFSVVRQSNRGRSRARNAGVAVSSGEFLCPLDADDAYLPDFLEAQHRFIAEHPGFDVYSCNVDAWMPDGSRSPYSLGPRCDGVVETRLDDLIEQNRLTVLSVFRRDMFDRLGGFRPSLDRLEDYDLWVRAAAAGSRLLHNPATLALYRQRPGRTPEEYRRMLSAQRDVLAELLRAADLGPQTRARTLASMAHLEAVAARSRLEQQMETRRFHGTRRLFWAARRTYTNKPKRLLALAAVTASPRLLASMTTARRRLLMAGGESPPAAARVVEPYDSASVELASTQAVQPRVTVVIPNWNGLPHLPECLETLAAQSFTDFEVIVVDNASTDGGMDWVRAYHPAVRIVQRADNGGFSKAVNAGILASRGEYVALLNNDTAVHPDWLGALLSALAGNRDYHFAASKMVFYSDPGRLNAAGDAYMLGRLAGCNRGLGESASRYAKRERVLGACAGAAMYRRSLFDEVGLFDEDFFLMSEDTDFNLRCLIAGKRCLYVPEARVQHKYRASIDTAPEQEVARLAIRNEAIVAGKDLPLLVLALCPLLWPLRYVRQTLPVRPSKWHLIPLLLRQSPERLRAELEGVRIGLVKRPDVWIRRAVGTLEILRWLLRGVGPA